MTLGASRLDRDGGKPARRGGRHRGSSATTAKSAWPWKDDLIDGKERIVAESRRHVVLARYVGCGEDRDDASAGADLSKLKCGNAPAGLRRLSDGNVKRALGLADIIDVLRRALHVLRGGIMRESAMDVAKRLLPSPCGEGSGVRGEGVELKRAEWISASTAGPSPEA